MDNISPTLDEVKPGLDDERPATAEPAEPAPATNPVKASPMQGGWSSQDEPLAVS